MKVVNSVSYDYFIGVRDFFPVEVQALETVIKVSTQTISMFVVLVGQELLQVQSETSCVGLNVLLFLSSILNNVLKFYETQEITETLESSFDTRHPVTGAHRQCPI